MGWGLKKYILVILSALMGNCHAHHYARTYRQAEQNRRLKSYVNRMGEPLSEEQQAKVLNDLLHVMQVDGLRTEAIHNAHYDGIYDLVKRFAERQGKRKVAPNSPDTPIASQTLQPDPKKIVMSMDTTETEEMPDTANAATVIAANTATAAPTANTESAVITAPSSGIPQTEVVASVEALTIAETLPILEQQPAAEADDEMTGSEPSIRNNFLYPTRQALRDRQMELEAMGQSETFTEVDHLIFAVHIPDNDTDPLYYPGGNDEVDLLEDSTEVKATSAVLSDALNALNGELQCINCRKTDK
ncbi:uncharacterized protein LOC129593807 isoform X1 [Paramacrobiotus metropolitanus]|uniref:uncharacterized protein LOC129593807 isoform X1 n=1 Tax=Paramacrobiotus metropolitanus TaxID=2943436 RepID=UPI002445746F|nr:uncharacterized protein LOC129593807 isoform X1 [Paramacrobiotus metropolitanus]